RLTNARNGYTHLYAFGATEYAKEHVLVAEAAWGPRPPGAHVYHRNRDRRDNRPDNLEYLGAAAHGSYHGLEQWRQATDEQRRTKVAQLVGGLSRRRSYAGADNPRYGKRGGSERQCLRCATSFYNNPPSRAGRKFCSAACYRAARRDGLNHRLVSIQDPGPPPMAANNREAVHKYI